MLSKIIGLPSRVLGAIVSISAMPPKQPSTKRPLRKIGGYRRRQWPWVLIVTVIGFTLLVKLLQDALARDPARQELEAAGFEQSIWIRSDWALLLASLGVLFLLFFSLVKLFPALQTRKETPLALFTISITVSLAIFGYYRWHLDTQADALDKFYQRLEITNDALIEEPAARALLSGDIIQNIEDESPKHEADWQRIMYVYREMDNLEYSIQRYALGYISPEEAVRALRTFKLRCREKEFRNLVLWVAESRAGAGDPDYYPSTLQVIFKACSNTKAG